MRKGIGIVAIVSLLVFSCSEDENSSGENLYKDITGRKVEDTTFLMNPTSIEGLHQQIFLPKCATSGCHDGHFEPDFRTIQSSYTTLVRADVFKQVDPFSVRVDPGEPEKSWLWERLTTDDVVLGKMPLYDDALSQKELDNISTWIKSGAKDINGNTLPIPDNFPVLYGYYITKKDDDALRYDNIREPQEYIGKMKVPKNQEIDIWIGLLDAETDINALKVNELQFSTDRDDFSNSVKATASFVFPAKVVNDYFGPGNGFPFFYKATVNTSQWNSGDQVYMRYFVKDGGHADPVSLPGPYAEWYFKNRNSMLIGN